MVEAQEGEEQASEEEEHRKEGEEGAPLPTTEEAVEWSAEGEVQGVDREDAVKPARCRCRAKYERSNRCISFVHNGVAFSVPG